MYFGHKHVETGPNCSHGLATFFKYHMPLTRTLGFICVALARVECSKYLFSYAEN